MLMRFIIENNKLADEYDFVFALLKNIKFIEFTHFRKILYKFCNIDKLEKYKNYIPIGSVEFVTTYLKIHYDIDYKPLNVPKELFKYANRDIINSNFNKIFNYDFSEFFLDEGYYYIKSNDNIKDINNGLLEMRKYPEGDYQISKKVENIESEFRIFIHNSEIIGIKNYVGDENIIPNLTLIKDIKNDFEKNYPNKSTYSFDVGITKYGTNFLIECHDFFSLGLYGLNYNNLAFAFYSWFYNYIKKKN